MNNQNRKKKKKRVSGKKETRSEDESLALKES